MTTLTRTTLTPEPPPRGYPALCAGRGDVASGKRVAIGSGVGLDGAAALDIGAGLKMVKVLKVVKVLNFSGAGKSNIFTVAGRR